MTRTLSAGSARPSGVIGVMILTFVLIHMNRQRPGHAGPHATASRIAIFNSTYGLNGR